MKFLTVLLVLVEMSLFAGCNKQERDAPVSTPTLTAAPTAAPVTTAPAPVRPPILAQSELFKYGDEYVGFEGKIYNPNTVALTNILIRWKVYQPWTGNAKVAENLKNGGFEESCGVAFAYIPPKTTYDFKTDKIRARTIDVMDSIGAGPQSRVMTDLKPEIIFTPEL